MSVLDRIGFKKVARRFNLSEDAVRAIIAGAAWEAFDARKDVVYKSKLGEVPFIGPMVPRLVRGVSVSITVAKGRPGVEWLVGAEPSALAATESSATVDAVPAVWPPSSGAPR